MKMIKKKTDDLYLADDGKIYRLNPDGSETEFSTGGLSENKTYSLGAYEKASHSITNPTAIPLSLTVYKNVSDASSQVNETIDFSNGDSSYYTFEDLATGTVTTSGVEINKDSGNFDAKIVAGVQVVIGSTTYDIFERTSDTKIKATATVGTNTNVAWHCYGLKLTSNKLKLQGANATYIPTEWSDLQAFNNALTDRSTYNNSFTNYTNTPKYLATVTPKFGYSYYANFDEAGGGTNWWTVRSAVNLDRFKLMTTDFMIDFWVNKSSQGLSGTLLYFGLDTADWSLQNYWKVTVESTSLKFSARDGGANNDLEATGLSYTQDQWYHIAIMRKSTYVGLFVDGVLKAKKVFNDQTYSSSSEYLYIGQRTNSGDNFRGRVQELRIVKGNCDYVVNDYSVGNTVFTPPTTAYTGYALIPINNTYSVVTEPIYASALWNEINGFAITSTIGVSDTVRYAVKFGSDYKIWNVNKWDTIAYGDIYASGMTEAQLEALTATEIQGTGGFVPGAATPIAIGIAVQTSSTATTFEIDKIGINYDLNAHKEAYYGSDVSIRVSTVYDKVEIENNTAVAKSGNIIIK